MIHIVPLNELNEHKLGTTCACKPKIEKVDNGELLVIHNAFDYKEVIEKINLN